MNKAVINFFFFFSPADFFGVLYVFGGRGEREKKVEGYEVESL